MFVANRYPEEITKKSFYKKNPNKEQTKKESTLCVYPTSERVERVVEDVWSG